MAPVITLPTSPASTAFWLYALFRLRQTGPVAFDDWPKIRDRSTALILRALRLKALTITPDIIVAGLPCVATIKVTA